MRLQKLFSPSRILWIQRRIRRFGIFQDPRVPITPKQNQKAHEVTRDVTAWACSFALASAFASGIEPILLRQVAPGLGPPRPAQREKCLALPFTQTVSNATRARARPTGRRGGFPTGRLWVFAYPDQLLGSTWLLRPLLADLGLVLVRCSFFPGLSPGISEHHVRRS